MFGVHGRDDEPTNRAYSDEAQNPMLGEPFHKMEKPKSTKDSAYRAGSNLANLWEKFTDPYGQLFEKMSHLNALPLVVGTT